MKTYKCNGNYFYPVPQDCPVTPASMSDYIYLKVQLEQSEEEQEKLQRQKKSWLKKLNDSFNKFQFQVLQAITVNMYLCSNYSMNVGTWR